jgi:hypothetical protein
MICEKLTKKPGWDDATEKIKKSFGTHLLIVVIEDISIKMNCGHRFDNKRINQSLMDMNFSFFGAMSMFTQLIDSMRG